MSILVRLPRAIFPLMSLTVSFSGACGDTNPSTDQTQDRLAGRMASCSSIPPNLSRVSASVQRQILEQRQTVTALGGGVSGTSGVNVDAAQAGDAYGALGMVLMAAKFPEAAKACFMTAASIAPDNFRWSYYLGHLHRDAGELVEASQYFGESSRLDPKNVAALTWLGDVRLGMGQAETARPLFERALSHRPESLAARFGLARAALLQEDYSQAVTLLEDILTLDPDAAAAHYPLGMAYRGLGNDTQAERHLRQRRNDGLGPADPLMNELDTLLDSPRAYETRGGDALARQDWSTAEQHFRDGLALDPDNPALRHQLGTTLYLMGDRHGAVAEFDRVIETTPSYPGTHYSLGVLSQEAGRHEDAVDRFEFVLRSRPTDGEAAVRLALSLRRLGQPERALTHYREVTRMDPTVIEARFGTAMALVQLERYGDARDELVTATDGFPAMSVFPHALARLLAAAPDAAVRDGARALSIVERLTEHERTIDVGETMAMALAELGRFDEAASIQRQLIAAAQTEAPAIATRLRRNLALYERGQPCRTPWPANALP